MGLPTVAAALDVMMEESTTLNSHVVKCLTYILMILNVLKQY
jgi:hypothetical protein